MNSKTLVWAYLIILSFATILNLYIPKNEAMAKESVVIPGDAIRLRILANSDIGSDQDLKRQVRDAVNAKITLWVKDLTSLEKAKIVIKSKLPEIQDIAEKVVKEKGSDQSVNVKFGKVQFPTKLYGEFLYPAGNYQAILITLGEGKGANWWCVLYPPLCFLDFSNGVAVSDGFDEQQKAKAAEKETVKEEKGKDENQVSEESSKSVALQDGTEDQGSEKAVWQGGTQDQGTENESKQEETQDQATVNTAWQERMQNQDTEKVALADQPETVKQDVQKPAKKEPVYTAEDEQPIKVKFFVVELWQKLFN